MNKHDLTLDFTSLLDVVMILLFFFVLFTTFDLQKNNEENEKISNALVSESEALVSESKAIDDAKDNSYKNQQALLDFDNGSFISFQLTAVQSSDDWEMDVYYADDHITTITSSESLIDQMSNLFTTLNIHEDDAVIGVFSYDGNVLYTVDVVRAIRTAMNEIKEIHEHFYFSEINTSR